MLKRAGDFLVKLALLVLVAWGTLAIYFSTLPVGLKGVVAVLFAIVSLGAVAGHYSSLWSRLGFLVVFAMVLIWWLMKPPSNIGNWQPDVARLAWAVIRDDHIEINNIRNTEYRSATDYTVRYYNKTVHLSKLKAMDLFVVRHGSAYTAHTMLSFDFGDDGVICVSIEPRLQIGESYSTLRGLFRQYELVYVVADERDLIGLRTSYRSGDEVHLYRLKRQPDFIRKVFLNYMVQVNSLKTRPEWYNALTSNSTTGMRQHTSPFNPNARFDWRIYVNGFIDELLYERGVLHSTLPFDELKKRSLINAKARCIDMSPDFSRLIREGLP